MFLGHGVTVINFEKATRKLNNLSSRNTFVGSNNAHNTLNQMIIADSTASENIDQDNYIQKINQRFRYSKNKQHSLTNAIIYNNAPARVETIQQVDLPRKSVITYRLKETIIMNKRLRKRTIMQSYKSWLRREDRDNNKNATIDLPEGQLKIAYSKSMIDHNKSLYRNHNMYKEKILVYGLFKNLKDTRPYECPYKSTKHLTHVNHGSAIFPRKNISPSLHRKCVCEHFSIAKSPLRTKRH